MRGHLKHLVSWKSRHQLHLSTGHSGELIHSLLSASIADKNWHVQNTFQDFWKKKSQELRLIQVTDEITKAQLIYKKTNKKKTFQHETFCCDFEVKTKYLWCDFGETIMWLNPNLLLLDFSHTYCDVFTVIKKIQVNVLSSFKEVGY